MCCTRRTAARARPPMPSSCCGWRVAWLRPRRGIRSDIRRSNRVFEPSDVLSTFPSIDTAVDNIKISQGLERVARVMDRGAIIRTFQAPDLGYILHSRHQYHWHTGYVPPQTVAMPHIGSVVSENTRAEESDRPGVHLDRPEHGNRRRERAAQGVSHRRLSRLGARSVSDHEPARCRRSRSASGRARRETLPQPSPALRKAAGEGAGLSVRGGLPARITHPIARIRRSPADLSVGESLRSVARAAAYRTTRTTPADSVRVACWPAVLSKPAPVSWR